MVQKEYAGTESKSENLDRLIKFERGFVLTVTGVPGSGKSEFVDEIANGLKSERKVTGIDCFCFFLKILVTFCLVITKLFITLFGSLEKERFT